MREKDLRRTILNKFIIPLLVFLFAVPNAYSARTFYKLKRGTVSFDVPNKWKGFKGVLEVPLALMSPKVEGKKGRISIGVYPLNVWGIDFDEKELENTQEKYKKGREKYLSKRKGKVVEFFPYKLLKWNKEYRVHSIGYRYTMNSIPYVERSYYLNCQSQIFSIKLLYREEEYRSQAGKIDDVLSSFRCKIPLEMLPLKARENLKKEKK